MNLFVQTLAKRAQKVLKNTTGESNRTSGLETFSAFSHGVVGSASSANLDGTGETDRSLVAFGEAVTLGSMEALGERSGGRSDSPISGENDADAIFPVK